MFSLKPWQDRSSAEQLTLALLAALVIAAILSLVYIYLRPSYSVLFKDMRSSDAATVVSALDAQKIPYRLADDGTTILVPDAVAQTTKLKMANGDLPLKGTVGFELFNKADLGLTEFAQKINYQRALQGELARTIMSLDGIDAARVHLAMPESTLFRRDAMPPTASVTLTPKTGTALPDDMVRGVQRLVAASVPNLRLGDVAVFDHRGALVSREAVNGVTSNPYLQQKAALEAYYAQKIAQVIEPIYGAHAITASVDVILAVPKTSWADVPKSPDPGSLTERLGVVADSNVNGLAVSIIVRVPISEVQKAQIRDMASAAVGLNVARGDSLSLFVSSTPLVPTTTAGGWDGASNNATPSIHVPSPYWGLLSLSAIAAALVVFALWRGRRTSVVALTSTQREERIARLRALLGEDTFHAPR